MTLPNSPFASPSPSPSPSFHFPGPSSRYNKRERDSSYTRIPIAHRRSQSNVHATTGTLPTPPRSETSRSPLARLPSYKSAMAPNHTAVPHTPARNRLSSSAMLHDSPFSDYFTDESRSVGRSGKEVAAAYHTPSSDTQTLLVRLGRLQQHLMRDGDSDRDAVEIVRRKLSEVDHELANLHSQSNIEDSGFIDDDGIEGTDGERPDALLRSRSSMDNSAVASTMDADLEKHYRLRETQRQAEYDYQLLESQRVLDSVTRAQTQLRQRYEEARALNDQHIYELSERDIEQERLQAENETLKGDLVSDHSELLCLRSQMKALSVEVGKLRKSEVIGGEGKQIARPVSSNAVKKDVEKWSSDWREVDARMKGRRDAHGVVSKHQHDSTEEGIFDGEGEDESEQGPALVSDEDSSLSSSSTSIDNEPGHCPLYGHSGEVAAREPLTMTKAVPRTSAAQDLWQGLMDFAGMGDGRYD